MEYHNKIKQIQNKMTKLFKNIGNVFKNYGIGTAIASAVTVVGLGAVGLIVGGPAGGYAGAAAGAELVVSAIPVVASVAK